MSSTHPYLILISSLPKDALFPQGTKLVSMNKAIITELVVAGFGNTHTVFLARAALARLQEELGMAVDDVAMIVRGDEGELTIQQALSRDAGKNGASAFWVTLADLFFAPLSSDAVEMSKKCAKTGVDPNFMRPTNNRFRLCESALLVRTRNSSQREKVVGVLQGFSGELTRVPLEHWEVNNIDGRDYSN
jgi:uncharacterized membrane protein